MKKLLVLVTALLAIAPAAQVFGGGQDLPSDFSIVALDGTKIDFAAVKGAPFVMAVGAAWCPECRVEAPDMQKAYEAYRIKGVVFLGICGNSSEEQMREFIATYKLAFPVAADNGFVEAFGVRVIPQTFFFAPGGKFVKRIIGAATYREFSKIIDQLLAPK